MDNQHTERRRAARYPMEVNVIVRKNTGEVIPATAVNVSSAGMLLHVEQPSKLSVDEEVTVEIALADKPDQPFSAWGAARVVRRSATADGPSGGGSTSTAST